MTRRRFNPPWIAWLFAVAFVSVQAIALAHEVKHDLRQHDDASCVLHLQAKSAGGNAQTTVLLMPFFTGTGTLPASDAAIDLPLRPNGYDSRAPPSVVV